MAVVLSLSLSLSRTRNLRHLWDTVVEPSGSSTSLGLASRQQPELHTLRRRPLKPSRARWSPRLAPGAHSPGWRNRWGRPTAVRRGSQTMEAAPVGGISGRCGRWFQYGWAPTVARAPPDGTYVSEVRNGAPKDVLDMVVHMNHLVGDCAIYSETTVENRVEHITFSKGVWIHREKLGIVKIQFSAPHRAMPSK